MCMYFTKGINQNGYVLCLHCNMKKDMHPIFTYLLASTSQCDDIVLLIQEYIEINNYKNIAGGTQHSIVLLQDNTVKCWGNNRWGQCNVPDSIQGNNHNVNINNNNVVGKIISIECGDSHSCALLNDNTVRCWGDNSYGQCDVPDSIQGKVVSISCGSSHTIALLNNNAVTCWGNNDNKQCNVPDSIQGKVVSIECGSYHSCAVLDDNTVICWGDND